MNRSILRRLAWSWIALELGAGILALALLVATLPLVVLAFPELTGNPIPTWALAVSSLTLSIPLALLLARDAMRIPVEMSSHP